MITRLRQLLRRARKTLDRDIQQRLNHVEGDIPCRRCTTPHCCNVHTLAYPIEVRGILNDLERTWSPERRLAFAHRLLGWLKTYREASVMARLDDAEWLKLKVPCPFLDEGRCSIYEIRPAACRIHYVLGQEPEVCGDAESKDIWVNMLGAHSRFSAQVLDGGAPPIYAPLPLMILKEIGLGDITDDEYRAYFLYTKAQTELGHRSWSPLP